MKEEIPEEFYGVWDTAGDAKKIKDTPFYFLPIVAKFSSP